MADRPSDDDIAVALFVLAGAAGDLSLCPYYDGTGTCMQMDVCTYAMGQPEPMCVTCVPSEGWPLDHHLAVREWMRSYVFTTTDLTDEEIIDDQR